MKKILDNQAFYHTNSLTENNLTLIKGKDHSNTSEVIHFMIDPKGIITVLEGNGFGSAGINKSEFLNRNIFEITSAKSKFLSELKEMILSEESNKVVKLNSNSFDVNYSLSHNSSGEPTGIIGTATEVSNEIDLKEELQIHKSYFSQLFESSPEAIVIIDGQDRILNVNRGFETLFKFDLKDIKGAAINIIVPEGLSEEAVQISKRVCFGEIIKTETIRKRKDGSEVNVSVLGYPVTLKDGQMGIYWIFSDITERKQNEMTIRNSLFEKEILLKEVHHRVKNNLQIIGSLLKFQLQYIKDPEVMNIFKESQNRIRAISLIHEKLYQTKGLSRVDFAGYIKMLISQLFITFGVKPETITFTVNADNIFLSVDNAIPCGLIINELVTNSLRYAFPEDYKGIISIDLTYDGTHYKLKISDNGVGIPEAFEIYKPKSLGLKLVNTLVFQLDAHLHLESNNGTCYTITFSNMDYKNRI